MPANRREARSWYQAPGHFLTIVHNSLFINLAHGTDLAEDSIWARHLLTQCNITDPDFVHKFGFTVAANRQRNDGVADVVGFVAVQNWQPGETMAGKKLASLNWSFDQYLGQHV